MNLKGEKEKPKGRGDQCTMKIGLVWAQKKA
jgi:hypothetical protein